LAAQQPGSPKPAAVQGIAEINGVVITRAEFESKNSTRLFQARNTYFEAEKKALNEYIDERLLEEQARKEGISVPELYDRHVKSALPPDPSDEALRIYFEGLDTKESFESMRDKIREHLRQRRLEKVKAAYIESLRKDAKILAHLKAPRMEVPLQDYPVRGERQAPVLIVEYADYECPYCQQIEPVLQRVRNTYVGKVAFVYKDIPLPNHPNAQKASEAKLCAGMQGKYWEFHDLLVDSKQLQLPALKDFARSLKLNGEEFSRCLDSGAQAGIIRAAITEAQNLGVQGTPSFFINGRFFSGALTYEALSAVVEEELQSSSATERVARR
jgi:protein-disulfide isomerase